MRLFSSLALTTHTIVIPNNHHPHPSLILLPHRAFLGFPSSSSCLPYLAFILIPFIIILPSWCSSPPLHQPTYNPHPASQAYPPPFILSLPSPFSPYSCLPLLVLSSSSSLSSSSYLHSLRFIHHLIILIPSLHFLHLHFSLQIFFFLSLPFVLTLVLLYLISFILLTIVASLATPSKYFNYLQFRSPLHPTHPSPQH